MTSTLHQEITDTKCKIKDIDNKIEALNEDIRRMNTISSTRGYTLEELSELRYELRENFGYSIPYLEYGSKLTLNIYVSKK